MSQSIVFLDRETLDATVREPSFEHSYKEYEETSPDQIVERLKDATVCITNKVPMRADTLAQLPNLKLIAVAATGTDIIDKAAAKEHGVAVVNIRNYAFNTVPEHVIALMFALKRNLLAYATDVQQGRWGQARQFCFFDHPIHDIAGATMGIVRAMARSASRSASAARRSAMKLLAYDVMPQDGLVDLETILTESDVITLHAPLTPETRNMIGADQLKMMKKNAILINTARGGLVDETALAEALKSGEIAGAGFDVLDRGAAEERQRAARSLDSKPDRHATRGLGEPGGDADPLRPARRQHRGVRRWQARNVVE